MDRRKWCTADNITNKILVIGDIILEQFSGYSKESLPSSMDVSNADLPGDALFLGGAANAAVNIRAMGGQVMLAGTVGQDSEGTRIQRMLKTFDIPMVLRMERSRPTTIRRRLPHQDHKPASIDREHNTDISGSTFEGIVRIMTAMPDIALVVVSDHDHGVVTKEFMEGIICLCKYRNIPLYVKSAGGDFCKYEGAAIVQINIDVLEALVGSRISTIPELETAAASVVPAARCHSCIVTWEEEGAFLFDNSGSWVHYPREDEAHSKGVLADADAFLAVLAMGYIVGLTPEEACYAANRLLYEPHGMKGNLVIHKAAWEKTLSTLTPG